MVSEESNVSTPSKPGFEEFEEVYNGIVRAVRANPSLRYGAGTNPDQWIRPIDDGNEVAARAMWEKGRYHKTWVEVLESLCGSRRLLGLDTWGTTWFILDPITLFKNWVEVADGKHLDSGYKSLANRLAKGLRPFHKSHDRGLEYTLKVLETVPHSYGIKPYEIWHAKRWLTEACEDDEWFGF